MTAQPKPTAADVPYTPDTTLVRWDYAHDADDPADIQGRGAEFDRWLAEHDAQVAAQALRELVSDRADIEEALAKIAGTQVSPVDLIVHHVNAEADRIAGEES